MQLVSKPQQFDVMVTPNFYGSLVSNAVAGLMGGPGVAPGVSLGVGGALFEQGARHVGMDIRGKDVANPTAILFSSVMLLRYLKMPNFADRMEAAIFATCVPRRARRALAAPRPRPPRHTARTHLAPPHRRTPCSIQSGMKTKDVGGSASTSAFVEAVIARLNADSHLARAGKTSKGISRAV